MLASKTLKEGPGLPIVFLHGFLGTSEDWEAVCSYLSPCHCVGFDLPGHGRSPFTKAFEIPLPRFHLVGYSMGGRLALGLPREQIASLTLISVHPGLKTEAEKEQRRKDDAAWIKLLFELPIDDFLLRWYDQSLFKPFRPDFSMRRKQNRAELAAALEHYSLAKQPYYELDDVLVGERDAKFRALYKQPIVVAGAGHAVHLENPKAVAAIIQQRIAL